MLYVAVGLPLAWLPTNLPRYAKRTYATGLQLTFGKARAFGIGIQERGHDSTDVSKGKLQACGIGAFCVVYGVMWVSYRYINKRRAQGLEDEKISSLSEQDILGYKKGDMTPLMFPKVSCKPVA
jgi:hypothetical protein